MEELAGMWFCSPGSINTPFPTVRAKDGPCRISVNHFTHLQEIELKCAQNQFQWPLGEKQVQQVQSHGHPLAGCGAWGQLTA